MVNFKVDAFVTCINELVRADETERALWLCDNLPAYYRDNKPVEVTKLKEEIIKRICTPVKYGNDSIHDTLINHPQLYNTEKTLRAVLMCRDVKLLNDQGLTPHIVDMGPGEYWLPILFKRRGFKFTYFPVALADKARKVASQYIDDVVRERADDRQPIMYVACEIIEHLWWEKEIRTNQLTYASGADIVHISTPKYTYGFKCEDWQKDKAELGHLRAYTPGEFTKVVIGMFGDEYSSGFYDSLILHLRLVKRDTKFKIETILNDTGDWV